MNCITIYKEEVLQIHNALVSFFKESGDPISPSGVKDAGLLESAVERQNTGFGLVDIYPSCEANAATLLYGLCCNHPFHNGNKRTALVSLLVHLNKNNKVFLCSHDDLYNIVMRLTEHKLSSCGKNPDKEIEFLRLWIKENTREVKRGDRVIHFSQLRKILARYGFYLKTTSGGTTQEIYRDDVRKTLLGSKKIVPTRYGRIYYGGDSREVSLAAIKQVRKDCKLTEDDGVDSKTFYDDEAIIDYNIAKWSRILKRLADK